MLTASSHRTKSTCLVSVVTVVLNAAQTLERCVESVVEQGYPDIEHIIVDGGSTDNTLDVLKRLDKHLDFWVSELDQGISDAFNKGIALSHGEIIGLLNSDDWYAPNAIRNILGAFSNVNTDIAYGYMQYWKDSATPGYLVESDHRKLLNGMTIGHPTVFAARRLYQRIGPYRLDFRFAMDYEWLLRAFFSGAAFAQVPEVVANMTEGGIGDRNWVRSLREVVRARAMHIPGESGRWAQVRYFLKKYLLGTTRRNLDKIGAQRLRRIYHRYFSPIRVRVT